MRKVELAGFPKSEKEMIFGRNIAKLLGLKE